MFHRSKLAALIAATTVLTLGATSAWADLLDNDLAVGVDSDKESMHLTLPDSTGQTTLSLVTEGREAGDHPGCNINGAHTLTVSATVADPSVASVALSNGGVFGDCTDTVVATVTPLAVGTTDVTFDGIASTSNDPHIRFTYSGADFRVIVTEGTSGGDTGTVCDADPAAPAWAAALIKGNPNIKAKATTLSNYISSVARHMGARATFDGWVKSAHPEYETAVWTYMKTALGLNLPNGPAAVARPGWECTTVS